MVHINSIYKHYKGNLYKVIAIAKHSETMQDFVVYSALYGNQEVWIRSIQMFEEIIIKEGIKIERFKYVKK